MKKIYLLFTLLLTLICQGQNCDLGYKNCTVQNITHSNVISGFKLSLSQESTLRSLNLIGNGTNSRVQMALYSDNNGAPNNLIVSSIIGNVLSGEVSLSVTPTLLSPGDYWIMAVFEESDIHINKEFDANSVVYAYYLNFGDIIPDNASNFLFSTGGIGGIGNYYLGLDCGNTLSIDSLEKHSQISIYPNPARDYIQVKAIDKPTKYEIYNTLGSKVKKGSVDVNQQIITQELQSGVYLISLENKGSLKFIKK